MKICRIVLLFMMVCIAATTEAQHANCALDEIYHSMGSPKPRSIDNTIARKSTQVGDTIPVIFHIVLNASQLKIEGDAAGIIQRAKTQIDALNRDFNAANSDSIKIPAPFKPLYGNVNLFFGMAHTAPDGKFTPGYTIDTAFVSGFDVFNGSAGTGYACSDAKYKSAGGVDAWNPKRYLNVWVVNIESLIPGGSIDGIATHPDLGFPEEEYGCVIHYGSFGQKTGFGQYYQAGVDSGRTLVHEVGHFFGLYHIWGTDNGDCSTDDGVGDTPLQTAATTGGCPMFPRTDACSPAMPGIMFMNYMDYAAQACQYMFSKGQADVMNKVAHDFYPEIIVHPELLDTPVVSGIQVVSNTKGFTISPNPSNGSFKIAFAEALVQVKGISVIDMMGRVIKTVSATNERIVPIHLEDAPAGVYIVRCYFVDGMLSGKIMLK